MPFARTAAPAAIIVPALLALALRAFSAPQLMPTDLAESFVLSAMVRAGKAAGRAAAPTEIVFNWQPDGDHYAVRLCTGRLEVVRRMGEKPSVLGQAPLPDREVRFLLKRRGEEIVVTLDDAYAVRAKDAALTGGRYGGIPGEAVSIAALRYQPTPPVRMTDGFERTPDEPSAWEALVGDWSVAGLSNPGFSANAFCFRGRGMPARAQTGEWFWQDYRLRVAVKPSDDADFGVFCAARDKDNYLLLRFRGRAPNEGVDLVEVAGGKERILATTPGRLKTGEWHEIGVDAGEDRIAAWAGGYRLFERALDRPVSGKVGLFADAPEGIFFDDMSVLPPVANGLHAAGRELDLRAAIRGDTGAPPVAHTMAHDKIMEEWAAQQSFWAPGGAGRPTWHRERFFKDTAVTWTPPGGRVAARVHLLLHCDGPSAESGYSLMVTPNGQGTAALALKRAGDVVAEGGAVLPQGKEVRITLGLLGDSLAATINEIEALSYKDAAPLASGRVGALCETATIPPAQLSVASRNLYDYPFSRAPVDWDMATGEWGIQSRWDCTPRWSWLGGRSPFAAATWHRDRFQGDFVLDFNASLRMDTPFSPLYRHPGDLCATVCGNGKDLNSGYAFIYGGWGNTRTAILRGDKIVAETDRFLLPDNLNALDGHRLHKQWYRMTVQRQGNTFRLLIDRQLALEYTDPSPLPGDRLAIWTYDNPMMLARARIHYAEKLPRENPLLPPAEPSEGRAPSRPGNGNRNGDTTERDSPRPAAKDGAWQWDFENGFGGFANADGEHGAALSLEAAPHAVHSGRRSLRLTNINGGGTFAARVGVPPFDVDVFRRLRFAYRIPKGVRVDLYFRSGSTTYFLALTGTREDHEDFIPLGSVSGAADDGAWHIAEADLASLFRRIVPASEQVVIDDLRFADLDARDYRLAGFGGNTAGATYWLDDFYLGPMAGNAPAEMPAAAPAARVRGRMLLDEGFEDRLDGWSAYGGDQGASLSRYPYRPAGGRWCLRAVNTQLGGTAGFFLPGTPFDLVRHPAIEFDYRVGPSLRVDLECRINGEWLTVKFTDNDATFPVLGLIPGVTPDRQWHHAVVNLAEMARGRFPAGPLSVTALRFASGGWPGNREGETYYLDNVRIRTSENAAPAPTVAKVFPADGARSGENRVEITLEESGRDVGPADLRVTIGGSDYDLSSPSVAYDAGSRILTWDGNKIRPRGRVFADGEKVPCAVRAVGGAPPDPFVWTWTMDFTLDKTPPPAPYICYLRSDRYCRDTFERDTSAWGNFSGAQVLLSRETSASGEGAVEIMDLGAGSCNVLIREIGFPIERYPIVAFEYRLSPGMSLRRQRFTMAGVSFDGRHDAWPPFQSYGADDDAWRHGEFDLAAAIRRARGNSAVFEVRRLIVLAQRLSPNGPDYWMDNFTIASDWGRDPAFEWNDPPDASGIRGYRFVLDRRPDTVPPPSEPAAVNRAAYENVEPGVHYFHLSACDHAGNWSAPAHYRIEIKQRPE